MAEGGSRWSSLKSQSDKNIISGLILLLYFWHPKLQHYRIKCILWPEWSQYAVSLVAICISSTERCQITPLLHLIELPHRRHHVLCSCPRRTRPSLTISTDVSSGHPPYHIIHCNCMCRQSRRWWVANANRTTTATVWPGRTW